LATSYIFFFQHLIGTLLLLPFLEYNEKLIFFKKKERKYIFCVFRQERREKEEKNK